MRRLAFSILPTRSATEIGVARWVWVVRAAMDGGSSVEVCPPSPLPEPSGTAHAVDIPATAAEETPRKWRLLIMINLFEGVDGFG
jgi:hypothetical protein